MVPAEQLKPALRELAVVIITTAEQYGEIMEQLSVPDPAQFAQARQKAYNLSISSSQVNCAAVELVPSLRNLDPEWRPPMPLLVLLGSLTSALLLIAAADSPQRFHDLALPSIDRVYELLSGQQADRWLQLVTSQSE